MMGLGYLGSSSSSSSTSSNLSPLAPPFTVDRSNQHNKPVVNSNSIPHLNGASFTSSWPYSHSSSSVRHSFMADSPRTTTTTTLPLNDSGYMIPEAVNLPTTGNWSNGGNKHGLEQITPPQGRSHWSTVYPNPSPKHVTDSFSYNLSEAKPFYPPYAAAAASVNIDDDIPLVTFSEPGYDLLSHGDEASKVDYTRSLSGLEYKHHHQQQQESVWSGLPDGKQLKKMMDTDDSFFSEEANLAASLAYNSYLNQGAYGTETSRKTKDDPSLFYYADIIRRANNTGSSTNGKSDANNHRLDPNDLSKGGSTFRAFPMFSESHPLIQSPEPPEDLWNSQNSYNPYEKRYHMFDCSDDHMPASISKSSTVVIKPPATVSTFSAKTISSKGLEIGKIGNLSALNINDVVGSHKPLKEKEQASGSFLAPNQLSFQIGRTNERTFVAPPSSTKEDVSVSTKLSANDQLNFEFKARPSFQVPEISLPYVNTTENVKITANSFEQFDHHNPAEDSPCWKGAPTSQFLPFESESPQPPMKKLQTGNGVDLQTDSSFKNSSGVHKIGETDERTSGPITKEHTVEVVDVGASSSIASNGGGVHSVHDTIKPKKGHGSLNESTSDANSQTPKLQLPTPEMDDISPEMKMQLLYGDAATAKNVNASGIVNSLYNLSDMLLLHCSNDEFALKEHDRDALDHVIRNLGVCMSREVQVASAHKSMMPQQKTANKSLEGAYGILHDDQTGESDARYQKQNSDMFGTNVEKLLEHASLRVEANPPKDHDMVQAIKKVLDDNVECKVELPSETLLYKNLWLEAEAELCSLSFRARFERLKRETKKEKPDKLKARDAASSSGGSVKEISSCDDPKILSKPIPKDDGSKVPITHIDDAEASVMARFNILKRREEPNPVDVQVAGVKVFGKGSQGPEVTVVGKENAVDIDPWVMDRLNILKRRGELNANDVEEKEVRDCGKVAGFKVFGKGIQCPEVTVVGKENAVDIDPWVMDRLNILKRRGELHANDVEEKEVRDCGKEGPMGGHFQDEEEEEEEEEEEAAVGSGGSDWEHILKDDFSWRLS